MGWTGHVRNAYKILVGKPEGNSPLGNLTSRWDDNTKMEWGGMDWIHLAQDRGQWRILVNTIINLRFP
jgi:hypothetical protein